MSSHIEVGDIVIEIEEPIDNEYDAVYVTYVGPHITCAGLEYSKKYSEIRGYAVINGHIERNYEISYISERENFPGKYHKLKKLSPEEIMLELL